VQAGLDAIGDDAGPVAVRRRRGPAGDALREEQAHAVRASQVEVLADHGLEEVAALHGAGKHLCEADLHLLQGEPMRVPGGPVGRGQRCREPRGPAIEERLHVGGAELIADGLQAWRVGTREEAIVETLERQSSVTEFAGVGRAHPSASAPDDIARKNASSA
jgi:hypothetical protein